MNVREILEDIENIEKGTCRFLRPERDIIIGILIFQRQRLLQERLIYRRSQRKKLKFRCALDNEGTPIADPTYHTKCSYDDPLSPNYHQCPRFIESKDRMTNMLRGRPINIYSNSRKGRELI